MAVLVRPAGPADGAFLTQMLIAAAFWRPDGPTGDVESVLADRDLARYVTGWPRSNDLGVVAEDPTPVGAAWLRLFPEQDAGYGSVNEQTPELSIAVVHTHRGRGIGTLLLEALIEAEGAQPYRAVSLSLESDNPACRLYERHGFQVVGAASGSLTMLLAR